VEGGNNFAWPAERVSFEVEAGIYGMGKDGIYGMGKPCPTCGQRTRKGHGSIRMIKRDLEKYSKAAALGWRIVRVTPDDLYRPKTVDLLRRALACSFMR
jgi:hypothetical protein